MYDGRLIFSLTIPPFSYSFIQSHSAFWLLLLGLKEDCEKESTDLSFMFWMLRIVLVTLNKSKTFLINIFFEYVSAWLYCIELKIKKEQKKNIYLKTKNLKQRWSRKHIYNSIYTVQSENPSPTTKRMMGRQGQQRRRAKVNFIVNLIWIFVSNQSLLLLKAKICERLRKCHTL